MSSTWPDESSLARRAVLGLLSATAITAAAGQPLTAHENQQVITTMTNDPLLTSRQLAIGPVAACTASGDMPGLVTALDRGLDSGLDVSDAKEILVQLYAYAGFPRSLNALSELMKVVEDRRQRGIKDALGRDPSPVPTGQALLEAGTANQTRLSGAPVKGPLFDFAPAIDQYLKSHLFGDIFCRDNLDWQSRELATVAALSALAGVDSQLGSHLRISMNVGLTVPQLRQFARELSDRGLTEAGQRLQSALDKQDGQATRS